MNDKIVNLCQEKLSIFNNLLISSIHHEKDICFNSEAREILYEIRKCFEEELNADKLYIEYKESILGKALVIKKNTISKDPEFKNIITHYHKFFFERLKIIEGHYKEILHNDYQNLIYEKNLLLQNKLFTLNKQNKYYCLYLLELPRDIIKIILSYLIFDHKCYQKLRLKYEVLRKSMSFKSKLS